MSGSCVTKVLESGLEDWLKKTAVACATFAADDGSRVWPSVRALASLSNQSERTVQNHLRILQQRTPPVLILTRPATQHRPAHYRLLVGNLPARPVPVEVQEEPLLPIGGEAFVTPDVTPDVRTDVLPDVRPDVPPDVRLAAGPGVQLVAPLASRGATQSARGATLVAPDPSLGSATSTPRAAAPPQRDTDDDYTVVVTAVVTKDILPRRLEDQALLDATRARCVQLGIPCTDETLRKAIDSAHFRYYRALRLASDLPPDPRGIYHDHVTPRPQRLPMPMGVKRARGRR